MKSSLFAALLLMNVVSPHFAVAQEGKAPPPNAIVVEETKTVEVAPKKKPAVTRGTSKKVTTGKNSFITTTTITKEVPAAPRAAATPATPSAYPQQNYSAPVITAPVPSTANVFATPAPSTTAPSTLGTSNSLTAVAATPTPDPNPQRWNLFYMAEYFGPRFSNPAFSYTAGPRAADFTSYTAIDQQVKVSYLVAKNNKVGVQIRSRTSADPEKGFFIKNPRLFGTWKNMIDTSDINMGSQLDVEFPNSYARENGKLLDLNFRFNWELKTALRNWSFTAMTMIRTSFFNDPTNKSDLYLGLFPWITMDLAPGWLLIFEGSFDASHSYQDIAFNLNTTRGDDDPDYIRTGFGYNFNSNISINPSVQWYTSDINLASTVFYLSLSASI